MTGIRMRLEFESGNVLDASGRGAAAALRRTGAYVRKAARNKISKSSKASAPGSPPHTRRGLVKRSVLFGVEKQERRVVIGPAFSLIADVMTAHEYGGRFRKREYPRRPLMGPTLEETGKHLPKFWEESLK